MQQIFLNFGYMLMLIALVFRDILWLRATLLSAQLSLIAYAVTVENRTMIFWNFLFAMINSFQIFRLAGYQFQPKISHQYATIYKNTFHTMDEKEFSRFFQLGTVREACEDIIVQKGKTEGELLMVLSGIVNVMKNRDVVEVRPEGSFISGLNIFHDETALADIKANGPVKYICWEKENLTN